MPLTASLGPIAFEAPRALWLLAVAAPALAAVALAAPVSRGVAGALSIAARTLVLAALALALARPVLLHERAAVSAVALLDVSASISDGDLGRERDLAARLARAAQPPHELRLVTFAARPAELVPAEGSPRGGAAPILARPAGTAALDTDIARAVGLGAGLLDPERTPRLLVASDGRATRGDLLAQAAALAARGVRLDYVALEGGGAAGGAADVAVIGLDAPDDVQPRAAFPLAIRLAADRAARVRLHLSRDGQPAEGGDAGTPGERLLSLAAGETTVAWTARIEATGTAVFRADVRPAENAGAASVDAHPENDRGVLAIAIEQPPSVLVLAAAPADAAPLVSALETEKIDVRVRAPSAALDAQALARADLVALVDVPGAALTDALVAALDRYVRDDGGGLLVIGGAHAFGPGGWDATRFPALLPVRLDLPERQDEPTLALALVIDRSGSMTGPKMELTRQAARATAEMLPADDQIAVVAFDTQASPVVRLQRAANRLRIASDIGRIQAAGGTNILAGLREAVDQLAPARAKKKHVILLSDGQSPSDGIPELIDAAAGSRITVSTVGVGEGVDDALLQMIANRGGGRYYHTRDPASIPRIFTREASEVASTGVIERPTSVVARRAAEMLAGVPIARAPALGGYVRTRPRAQAELLLSAAGAGGDPLLARWSVGLGQVVAWTSDLGPRWAATWTRWPPFAKLWAQVARGTMRARAAERFPLTARVEGGVVEAAVEAVGHDDRFLSGLEGSLEVTSVGAEGTIAAGPPRKLPLVETAPGRYQARFAAATGDEGGGSGMTSAGALLLAATLNRDGRALARATGRIALPFAPELLPIAPSSAAGAAAPGKALLESAAARTGGGALTTPEDLFRGARPHRVPQPLRSAFLLAAALLFLSDVALRRLAGNRRTPAPPRPPPRPHPESPR